MLASLIINPDLYSIEYIIIIGINAVKQVKHACVEEHGNKILIVLAAAASVFRE